MFEDLPKEVLHEILHKLPEESLMQLRCVSKSFNSQITSRAFIKFSSTPSKPDPNKLMVRYLDVEDHVERYRLIVEDNDNNDSSSSEQIQDLKFPRRSLWANFQLVGSANGLFCLYQGNDFFLWNPCIRKFITLPTHGLFSCYLGFGFDSRDDDYKVVEIAKNAEDSLVKVYSVRERSWRVARGGFSCPARITCSVLHPQPASLNGALYFVAKDWGGAQSLVVLSFDLGDEVFRVISLPNDNFGSGADIGISVFNGSLSLLSYEYQHRSSIQCCSVWVMKEYDVVDSWIKKFTIELNMRHWKVLGFFKNDHVLVQKLESHGSELLSYDPNREQVKNLGFYRSGHYSYADNYARNLNFFNKEMI